MLLGLLSLLVASCGGAADRSAQGGERPNTATDTQPATSTAEERPFGLLLHGGAGTFDSTRLSPARLQAWQEALQNARDSAYAMLQRGAPAEAAVVEAVRCLEDDSLFNAGRGAVLNANGRAELDASIMRGRDRQAGAVAALQRLRNPIQAAEAVLKYAPHVMLAGPAADRWGAAQGLDTVPNAYFITQRMRKYWRRRTAAESGQSKGTVGAVALDRQGDLAAATSTGGRMLKTPGRVGDSPLIGSGTYASKLCAVSATGAGEYFIRSNVAYQVHARMAYAGASLSAAADSAVFGPMARLGGDGGIIALSGKGLMATPFNTGGMLRSFRFSDGREGFAVYP